MELKTQSEMVKHLQSANKVCKDDLKEVTNNWNCGFLSTYEYLIQTSQVMNEWNAKVLEIPREDFIDVRTIINYLEVNGL